MSVVTMSLDLLQPCSSSRSLCWDCSLTPVLPAKPIAIGSHRTSRLHQPGSLPTHLPSVDSRKRVFPPRPIADRSLRSLLADTRRRSTYNALVHVQLDSSHDRVLHLISSQYGQLGRVTPRPLHSPPAPEWSVELRLLQTQSSSHV